MFITPAVVGDRLLVGSCAGTFFGVDAATGAVGWRHETAEDGAVGQFHGDALLAGDLAVVGSHGRKTGFLYAFEPASGRLRWKLRASEGFIVRALGHEDTVLATTLPGEVVAVALDDGASRWRLGPPDGGRSYLGGDPALAEGRLYVPRESGWIDAVDVATGELIWRRRVDATWTTSVALFEEELVVGTSDGRLLRLAPESGELLGGFDAGAPGGYLLGRLVDAGRCLVALEAGSWREESPEAEGPFSVACLRPAAGEVLWRRASETVWTSLHPLVGDGEVVVGSAGLLRALDLTDGSLLWRRAIAGTPRGLGAGAGTLYVGTREGELLALPTSQGRKPSRSKSPFSTSLPGKAPGST